jgi:tripartite-type tricarboxylate transporter receptor subunit TctC
LALLALIATPALAQNYPTKPIRLVVGFPPGGGTDIAARLVAPKLAEALGQSVIVDNRPGAASNIGMEHVVRSAPDGYTLYLGTPPVIVNKFLYKLSFDAMRDLVGVSNLYVSPNLLVVHASVPVKTVKDLVALARSRPGQLNFSSSAAARPSISPGSCFNLRAKVQIVHVPYRGTAPSLTALVGGEVGLSYAGVPVLMPFIKSGRLRPIASTGAKRTQLMPEVPTIKESGVDMEIVVWYGIFAPAATPARRHRPARASAHQADQCPGNEAASRGPGRGAGGEHPGGIRPAVEKRSRDVGRGGEGVGAKAD